MAAMEDSCVDVCCTEEKPSGSIGKPKEVATDVNYTADLEKGLSGKEYGILSVSAMTCTGCETKLKRTLGTIVSVKNLKTSLVLVRAEFDLDLGTGSVVEVMKHLERTTEFKCERVMNQGSSIDLTTPSDSSGFVRQDWPHGVTEMTVIDKKTVGVVFDAQIIGARELVEKGWGAPINLAAPRPDPTIEAGSKHVRHVGYMTLLSIVLTIPVLVLAWAPLPEKEIAYGSVSLVLATIVQCIIAGPFYPTALKSLVFSRMSEMDLLTRNASGETKFGSSTGTNSQSPYSVGIATETSADRFYREEWGYEKRGRSPANVVLAVANTYAVKP